MYTALNYTLTFAHFPPDFEDWQKVPKESQVYTSY